MILTRTEQQNAMDYIVYMIIGSYFASAKARTGWRENGMRLRYCLLGQGKQYDLEECCDKYFEEVLSDKIPEKFLEKKVDVYFRREKGNGNSAVIFSDGSSRLEVTALYGGRRRTPKFSYRLTAA